MRGRAQTGSEVVYLGVLWNRENPWLPLFFLAFYYYRIPVLTIHSDKMDMNFVTFNQDYSYLAVGKKSTCYNLVGELPLTDS